MKPTLAFTFALTVCSALAAAPARPITGVDRAYLKAAADPCKDFYAYANGAFDQVVIPGEYASYGVNEEINERSYAILKNILETSARTGGPKGSVAQRVGDFYTAGMDEAAIERNGLKSLQSWLAEIAAGRTAADFTATIGRLQAQGLDAGFGDRKSVV